MTFLAVALFAHILNQSGSALAFSSPVQLLGWQDANTCCLRFLKKGSWMVGYVTVSGRLTLSRVVKVDGFPVGISELRMPLVQTGSTLVGPGKQTLQRAPYFPDASYGLLIRWSGRYVEVADEWAGVLSTLQKDGLLNVVRTSLDQYCVIRNVAGRFKVERYDFAKKVSELSPEWAGVPLVPIASDYSADCAFSNGKLYVLARQDELLQNFPSVGVSVGPTLAAILVRIDLQSGISRPVANVFLKDTVRNEEAIPNRSFSISPDGSNVAFASDNKIYVVRL